MVTVCLCGCVLALMLFTDLPWLHKLFEPSQVFAG